VTAAAAAAGLTTPPPVDFDISGEPASCCYWTSFQAYSHIIYVFAIANTLESGLQYACNVAACSLFPTVLCCLPMCYAVLCRAVPCCAVLCRAVLCCAVLCRAVPCCAVLCRAVPCCVVLCRAVSCCAVLCLRVDPSAHCVSDEVQASQQACQQPRQPALQDTQLAVTHRQHSNH
jgi:hypothetical protein